MVTARENPAMPRCFNQARLLHGQQDRLAGRSAHCNHYWLVAGPESLWNLSIDPIQTDKTWSQATEAHRRVCAANRHNWSGTGRLVGLAI